MNAKRNFFASWILMLAMMALVPMDLSYAAPRTLTVGTWSGNYATLQAAVTAASNGDTILLPAGNYVDQSVTVNKDVILSGTGGKAVFTYKSGIANKKAYLVTQGNVTIRNVVFQNAQVPDKNGAGIRYEGGNLTVESSTFQDNQEGILGGAYSNGSITVNGSSFLRNGAGDGYSHGIYAGAIPSLTVTNSTFQGTKVGHHIKSRATNTVVTNCAIDDGASGTASYDIDLPNGGNATISGNTINKGSLAQNPTLISYGEEGGSTATGVFIVQNNTLSNALAKTTIGIKNVSATTVKVIGNTFNNVSVPVQGNYTAQWNKWLPDSVTTSVTLMVSADSYQWDPQLTLIADGKVLSGSVAVTASYASGSWQLFTFSASAVPSTLELNVSNAFVSSKGLRAIHVKNITIGTGTATIMVPLKNAQYKLTGISLDPDGTLGNVGSYQIYFPSMK